VLHIKRRNGKFLRNNKKHPECETVSKCLKNFTRKSKNKSKSGRCRVKLNDTNVEQYIL